MTGVINIKERERERRQKNNRKVPPHRKTGASEGLREERAVSWHGEKQVGLCFFVLLMFKTSLTVSPQRFRSPGPQRPAQSFKDMCSLNH